MEIGNLHFSLVNVQFHLENIYNWKLYGSNEFLIVFDHKIFIVKSDVTSRNTCKTSICSSLLSHSELSNTSPPAVERQQQQHQHQHQHRQKRQKSGPEETRSNYTRNIRFKNGDKNHR